MITQVQIQNLRGIREGMTGDLSPLSILVGPNNSGKSTILEAIAAVCIGPGMGNILRLLLRRGGPPLHALRHVFALEESVATVTAHIRIGEVEGPCTTSVSVPMVRERLHLEQARNDGLQEPVRMVEFTSRFESRSGVVAARYVQCLDGQGRVSSPTLVTGPPVQTVPALFVDVDAVRNVGDLESAYSSIEFARQVPHVVQALASSMPGLTDLRILKADDTFLLHTLRGDAPPVPTYLAGDGFKRFLAIAAAVCNGAGGVVLLEEPESFQHPRYLRELATLLLNASAAGTQVILSTHSMELIDLLLAGTAEHPDLRHPTVHRVRLTEGKQRAIALTATQAREAREELLEDLRA